MYFYPLDEAIAKMKTYGFDINKFHESIWNGKGVYVIGADKDDEETNQAWFDKEHYSLVRMIKYENGRKEDALLEDHVKLDGGYSETLVKFYMNDKLLQVEKYFDLEANKEINPEIFNTQNFIKADSTVNKQIRKIFIYDLQSSSGEPSFYQLVKLFYYGIAVKPTYFYF